MPDVIIGNVGHARIGDLRLGSQERFRTRGHANDAHPPDTIQVRLTLGAKTGTLYRNKCTPFMHPAACVANRSRQSHAQLRRERLGD